MKKMLKFPLMALLCLILMPGCASIVSRTNWPITISTTPRDAEVTITNQHGKIFATGTSSITTKLKASAGFFTPAEYTVTIQKPGYHEVILPLQGKINGWYFGNLLLGGLIGMIIVDPATGAMWKLETDYIHVNLSENNSGELVIMDINDLTEEQKEQLIPLSY